MINRRGFIRRAGLSAIALQAGNVFWQCNSGKSGSRKPNIVFIMTDDMGYGDASCYNANALFQTPNIDRLAAEGMMFSDAHSPSAVCTPTRYGLLTGRYCWRSRLKSGVFGGYDRPLIEKNRPTIASFLKENGYATACIGKWHLGWNWATKDGSQPPADGGYEQENVDFSSPITHGPNELGFDYFFGTSGCTTDDPPFCFIENDRATEIPDHYAAVDPADEDRRLLSVEGWRHEDADFTFAEKAIGFIEDQVRNHKLFFLYLPLSLPHIPWLPHEDFKGRSGAGPRGDQVLMADKIVGDIIKKLDLLGVSDNTLLIFTSDNGPRQGENGHKSAGDLRGYKGSIWEGGHRVPFIVRWPEKINPGSTCDQTITLADLMATAAAIVNQPLPQGAAEDSYNILPAFTGQDNKPIHDVTIHHSGGGVFAIREGDWKLIWESEDAGYHEGPVPGDPGQLYNLKEDPAEEHNLFDDKPGLVNRLSQKLAEVREKT